MNTCPKCGSAHIIGPRYVRDAATGREARAYLSGPVDPRLHELVGTWSTWLAAGVEP